VRGDVLGICLVRGRETILPLSINIKEIADSDLMMSNGNKQMAKHEMVSKQPYGALSSGWYNQNSRNSAYASIILMPNENNYHK